MPPRAVRHEGRHLDDRGLGEGGPRAQGRDQDEHAARASQVPGGPKGVMTPWRAPRGAWLLDKELVRAGQKPARPPLGQQVAQALPGRPVDGRWPGPRSAGARTPSGPGPPPRPTPRGTHRARPAGPGRGPRRARGARGPARPTPHGGAPRLVGDEEVVDRAQGKGLVELQGASHEASVRSWSAVSEESLLARDMAPAQARPSSRGGARASASGGGAPCRGPRAAGLKAGSPTRGRGNRSRAPSGRASPRAPAGRWRRARSVSSTKSASCWTKAKA